ncbi:hypothetical protein WJX81_005639 [Elliptochloris bilobata]|uniref:Hemimethylated DNA-binding domain-containing protein n=1 Tax=Elliptochloris bilobata TaxID=381761 RepID=A0AAW1QMU8_9CHLO
MVESRALQLLRGMEDPSKRHGCMRDMHALGENIVEYLARASTGNEPLLLGRRHFAGMALARVVSLRCAERMRQLLAVPGAETRLEEGALLLAQLHYLYADLTPVARFLDELGLELRRRMAGAGVQGGLPALALLSELLFGRRDPALGQDYGEPPDDWAWTPADEARLVLPRPGYGLDIRGNSRNFYDATNSLLPFVLVWRRGIPISLAKLHAAIGRRAGLPIEPVAVPMHFMNKMGEPGSPDERFIDVFRGGVLLTRAQTCALMAEMGVGVNEAMLRPVAAADVYVRSCANLVNQQYRQGGPAIHSKLRPVLDLLLAARPGARDYMCMRAFVEECMGDFHAARADTLALVGLLPDGPVVPQRLPADVQPIWARLDEGERDLEQRCKRIARREPGGALFRVGNIICHARYAYRGVIIGWDLTCREEETWIAQMSVDLLPRGRNQPFYHVLVDVRHRPCQRTYVAEENVREFLGEGEALLMDGMYDGDPSVRHPEVGEHFDGLPMAAWRGQPSAYMYQPNTFQRAQYPDDYLEQWVVQAATAP